MIGPKVPKLSAAELRAAERAGRAAVASRDRGVCVLCGRGGLVTNWDHRVDRSVGGTWSAANGQTLCGSGTTGCHGWKTGNPAAALAQGFACPRWVDPAVWPARRRSGAGLLEWVLYSADGGVEVIGRAVAARVAAAEGVMLSD